MEALLTADDLAILAEETEEADLPAEGMLETRGATRDKRPGSVREPPQHRPLRKETLLRRTGYLDREGMRVVSERVVTAQELNIFSLIRRKGQA